MLMSGQEPLYQQRIKKTIISYENCTDVMYLLYIVLFVSRRLLHRVRHLYMIALATFSIGIFDRYVSIQYHKNLT